MSWSARFPVREIIDTNRQAGKSYFPFGKVYDLGQKTDAPPKYIRMRFLEQAIITPNIPLSATIGHQIWKLDDTRKAVDPRRTTVCFRQDGSFCQPCFKPELELELDLESALR
jgi:hypothetical protein